MAQLLDLPEIQTAIRLKDAALSASLTQAQWQSLLEPGPYQIAFGASWKMHWVLLMQKAWHAALFFSQRGGEAQIQDRFSQAVQKLSGWSQTDFIRYQACFPFELQAKVLQHWRETNPAINPGDFANGLAVAYRFFNLPVLFTLPDVSQSHFFAQLRVADQLDRQVRDVETYLKQVIQDPASVGVNRPSFMRTAAELKAERDKHRRSGKPSVEQHTALGSEAELTNQRLQQEDHIVARHQAQAGTMLDGSAIQNMQQVRDQLADDVARAVGELQKNWQKEAWISEINEKVSGVRGQGSEASGQLSGVSGQLSEGKFSRVPPVKANVKSVEPKKAESAYSADDVIRKAKQQKSQVSTKMEPASTAGESSSGINIQN